MSYRLDEVDKRIIYRLMQNGRDTSAPMIADEVNVSPGTIRNRISQLETADILRGYHAHVDFERAEQRLTVLFVCNTPVPARERIATQVIDVPGVVNVRELLSGRRNLHVTAVCKDTDDLTRIAQELTSAGVEIEDESLVREEQFRPYAPFGPSDTGTRHSLTDFISLAGGAEVAELTIGENAPVAGKTLGEAAAAQLVPEELLVIAVERDEDVLTPKGDTELRPDDLVTVFSRGGVSQSVIATLTGEPEDTAV